MNDQSENRRVLADLHCHSSASDPANTGARDPLALPECATPPHELYELAKRRGMDFVTITDHNTIDGALELAGEPDTFVSEELTAWFKGEPQAVHVLCFGITSDDHDWLQAHSADVVTCAAYLHQSEIACALAHPFWHVAAPLTLAQRRTLAELFPVWETRNGKRGSELNGPAAVYIETHGGVGVGGSDDHSGVDVGRTCTESAHAATGAELLEHIRAGRVRPVGQEGSTAKSAHGALALAARTLGNDALPAAPDPDAVLALVKRSFLEGDARGGGLLAGLPAPDAQRLLRAWLDEMELELESGGLLELLQAADFNHSDLARRARRVHERKLASAIRAPIATARPERLDGVAGRLLSACLPAVPYIDAAAFLARERSRIAMPPDEGVVRVAVVADSIAAVHGIGHALAQVRERGIPDHEIDLVGTDATVDHRLPAVAKLKLPLYPAVELEAPSALALAEALTRRSYDLVHVCAPGPAGIAALLIAHVMDVPVISDYHADLHAYGHLQADDALRRPAVEAGLDAFYRHSDVVLSPGRVADRSVQQLGIEADRIVRWELGVDARRFNPAHYAPDALPGSVSAERFCVLSTSGGGRQDGLDLLVDAFLMAHYRDPRLHLVLAGYVADWEPLAVRLGSAATFLGPIDVEELARLYASADLFVLPSTTATSGQAILEAQASGLPVLAVDDSGSADLIESGRTGCLVPRDPDALASALYGLSRRGAMRERLSTGGLLAARSRSWERSLGQLADGYALARGKVRSPQAEAATATVATVPRAA